MTDATTPTATGAAPDQPGPQNLVDLIDALVVPAAPAPISMMPETWGWAVLAAVVALAAGWAAWRWIAQRRADAYRRAALGQLERAETGAEIATILRRAALAAYPRADVAGRTGADWAGFLDRTAHGGFDAEAARELGSAPYRADTAPASPSLRVAAERWLRTHRRHQAKVPPAPEREAAA